MVHSAPGLRARTYSILFGLLPVTGMRVSEAMALNRDDVDLKQGVITVRETKFSKSRLIPVHVSTQRALKKYARYRDRIYPRPKTPSFLVSEWGNRLGYDSVRATFVLISRKTSLRGPTDSHGPRMHDLRHRFASYTLLRWYRNGVDVDKHISTLATYLGHVKVTNTYWYLSAVPELMQLVAARLDHAKGGL